MSFVAAAAVVACADHVITDERMGQHPAHHVSAFEIGTDSIHWIGNVLAMEIDGSTYVLECDQLDATTVTIRENGSHIGTLHGVGSAGAISVVTFADPATNHWIRTDGDGYGTSIAT